MMDPSERVRRSLSILHSPLGKHRVYCTYLDVKASIDRKGRRRIGGPLGDLQGTLDRANRRIRGLWLAALRVALLGA